MDARQELVEAYQNWAGRTQDMPDFLVIEPIETCNLRCIMCHMSYIEPTKKRIDIDLTLERLSELPAGTRVMLGTAYEPTAHPDIIRFLHGLSELGLRLKMTTNGTLMTPRVIDAMLAAKVEHITISFDGIRKETYEWIRHRADWDMATRRIHDLRQAFMGTDTVFMINNVLMQKNLGELIETAEYWEREEMHMLNNIPMAVRLEDPSLKEQSLENHLPALEDALEELLDHVVASGMRLVVSGTMTSFPRLAEKNREMVAKRRPRNPDSDGWDPGYSLARGTGFGLPSECAAPFKMAHIRTDGRFNLCGNFPVGTIANQPISTLWRSAHAALVRQATVTNTKNCDACDFKRCVVADDFNNDTYRPFRRGGNMLKQIPEEVIDIGSFVVYEWFGDYYAIPDAARKTAAASGIGIDPLLRFFDAGKWGIVMDETLDGLCDKLGIPPANNADASAGAGMEMSQS